MRGAAAEVITNGRIALRGLRRRTEELIDVALIDQRNSRVDKCGDR